jgi:hypothetical protein
MGRITASLIVALGLVLGSAPMAGAKDLCVTIPGLLTTSSGGFVVGKYFTVPQRDRCKPFTGFVVTPGGGPGGDWFVSGVGCTSADGGFFRLSFTAYMSPAAASSVSANPFTVFCSIPRPSLTGGTCLHTLAVPSHTDNELFDGTEADAAAEPCKVAVP